MPSLSCACARRSRDCQPMPKRAYRKSDPQTDRPYRTRPSAANPLPFFGPNRRTCHNRVAEAGYWRARPQLRGSALRVPATRATTGSSPIANRHQPHLTPTSASSAAATASSPRTPPPRPTRRMGDPLTGPGCRASHRASFRVSALRASIPVAETANRHPYTRQRLRPLPRGGDSRPSRIREIAPTPVSVRSSRDG